MSSPKTEVKERSFECPKCNSKDLVTDYCDDEQETIFCKNCGYTDDVKEFVKKECDLNHLNQAINQDVTKNPFCPKCGERL